MRHLLRNSVTVATTRYGQYRVSTVGVAALTLKRKKTEERVPLPPRKLCRMHGTCVRVYKQRVIISPVVRSAKL